MHLENSALFAFFFRDYRFFLQYYWEIIIQLVFCNWMKWFDKCALNDRTKICPNEVWSIIVPPFERHLIILHVVLWFHFWIFAMNLSIFGWLCSIECKIDVYPNQFCLTGPNSVGSIPLCLPTINRCTLIRLICAYAL